ncbi:leucine-rich_repeat domain-containing protein [Hexamita inflata]|uniref:Leucine-rich repeat domain-containing protein n=1 Tax=Hexamita inflata TaxID=28002 RepID=A0AA86U3C4_9EUKA|nr:leucine-rich repeat domain-containing protein [Hexamita inflata]
MSLEENIAQQLMITEYQGKIQNRELFISGPQIIESFTFVSFLDIQKLSVKYSFNIQHVSQISNDNVTELLISGCKTDSVAEFEFERLQILHLIDDELAEDSLVNISKFTILIELDLSYNKKTGISHLQTLVHLKKLCLCGMGLKDISALAHMAGLEELNLKFNKGVCIAPLQQLVQLINLNLYEAQLTDIEVLGQLRNIQYLDLSYNPDIDLSPLLGLKLLSSLTLFGNNVKDLAIISQLTALQELNMSFNRGVNIHSISRLSRLVKLTCYGNGIYDLSELSSLKYLAGLDLSYNSVFDISPLQYLQNLNTVNLQQNFITDFRPLQKRNTFKITFGKQQRASVSEILFWKKLNAIKINSKRIKNCFEFIFESKFKTKVNCVLQKQYCEHKQFSQILVQLFTQADNQNQQ